MVFFGAIFRLRGTSECYDKYAAVCSASEAQVLMVFVLLKSEKSIVGLTQIFFCCVAIFHGAIIRK